MSDSLLRLHERHLLASIGVDDLIVVTTPDFTVVAHGNLGKVALELIELQSGSYLGEDDIVRFNDVHDRD